MDQAAALHLLRQAAPELKSRYGVVAAALLLFFGSGTMTRTMMSNGTMEGGSAGGVRWVWTSALPGSEQKRIGHAAGGRGSPIDLDQRPDGSPG